MASSSQNTTSAALGLESPGARRTLETALRTVAPLLPAQGPINVFVHHNTLHAFEDQPFEDALVDAGRRFGCEPFLAEDTYRAELHRGRIARGDLDAVLKCDLGDSGNRPVLGPMSRFELRRRILIHGIPAARGAPLHWLLSETDVLAQFRENLPGDAREALCPGLDNGHCDRESIVVRELWQSCVAAAKRSAHVVPTEATQPANPRHRDLLLSSRDIDIDSWIHPVLIRFTAAFLDQGLTHWSMPRRDRGMYRCFLALHGHRLTRVCGSWSRILATIVEDESGRDGWSSLQHSLELLGVKVEQWGEFLTQEALALRGWAGMVRQLEERPDLVPVAAVPARLVDFLAVRLLLNRAALTHASRAHGGPPVALAELRTTLDTEIAPAAPPTNVERAWPLFHVAQLCGLDAAAMKRLSAEHLRLLEDELHTFSSLARRRVFQIAFERHLRHRFYDAIVQHIPSQPPPTPRFQAIFCLDDREESIRRHLEEVDPDVETYGAAGFYGIAMYFRGATDAHPRALCPVAVQPQHYIAEIDDTPLPRRDTPLPRRGTPLPRRYRWRKRRKRFSALVDKNIHMGSSTFTRGAVIMATIGVLWVIPLVLRVIFPRWKRGLSQLTRKLSGVPETRLQIERTDETPPIGKFAGYTVDEMASAVHGQLAPLGIAGKFAPLVFVFGHGSASLNNPQESAHDCGACGGGRGGPNARAFAQMANDPHVRAALAELGMNIPTETWFIGGQRNTANNDIVFYDAHRVPEQLEQQFDHAAASIETARLREAHERCRRFATAPSSPRPQAALAHVQARASDLAQPRPEYGHASNAVCVIGRRSITKNLFLDRRAFLTSYDPTSDPSGDILAGLLAAVVPVVAGINLEYFFGYTDPTGYGCGTKLPHNVTGLLGVMDGPQSDLRTGLPWQMLEIHEPVRLTIAVETAPDVLLRIIESDRTLRRLVAGRWLVLAALDPASHTLYQIDGDRAQAYAPEHPLITVQGPSSIHYHGKRGHLPFVRIEPVVAEATAP